MFRKISSKHPNLYIFIIMLLFGIGGWVEWTFNWKFGAIVSWSLSLMAGLNFIGSFFIDYKYKKRRERDKQK